MGEEVEGVNLEGGYYIGVIRVNEFGVLVITALAALGDN